MLETELRQIGFKLATGDVQRRLVRRVTGSGADDSIRTSSRIISAWICTTARRSTGITRRSLVFPFNRSHNRHWWWFSLVEGNVITIEPGIYIPSDSSFPKHFHNMGVRIEVSLPAAARQDKVERADVVGLDRTTWRSRRKDRWCCLPTRRRRSLMLKAHVRVCWNDNGDHVLAPIHVMERLRARRTASCRAMSSHEFPHSGWESGPPKT